MLRGIPNVTPEKDFNFHFRGSWNPSRQRLHQKYFQPTKRCQILSFLSQNHCHEFSLIVFSMRSVVSSGDPPTSRRHQRALFKVRNRSSARRPGEWPHTLASNGEIGGNASPLRAYGSTAGRDEKRRRKKTSVSGTTCARARGKATPTLALTRSVPSGRISAGRPWLSRYSSSRSGCGPGRMEAKRRKGSNSPVKVERAAHSSPRKA